MFRTVGYFVTTLGYGIARNIYYIPKIKEVENIYKEPYVYKDRLIGDKVLNNVIGIVCTVSPLFVCVALYDDINRINAYFNKSLYIQHTILKVRFSHMLLNVIDVSIKILFVRKRIRMRIRKRT